MREAYEDACPYKTGDSRIAFNFNIVRTKILRFGALFVSFSSVAKDLQRHHVFSLEDENGGKFA